VLAWAAIFARAEREPRARQLAQMVVSIVNLSRSALVSAQPDKRRERCCWSCPTARASASIPSRTTTGRAAARARRTAAAGRRGGAPPTRRRHPHRLARDGESGFWVSFRIDGDDEYWVMLPRERVERGYPAAVAGVGVAVLLLALAGAYLIMFRVTRPLKALAAAAHATSAAAAAPPRSRRPARTRSAA
jgi:two-component system osmolarity sensor histidine kinase EnvZ